MEVVKVEKAVDIKNVDEAEAVAVMKQKKHRKRKKHYFNCIREQIEFYFGDANLSKDRFLKKLIKKDQYVKLEVFLKFNKMKTLTNSVADIAKSLSNSQLLELDDSQQMVRRKTALPAERDVDDKMLYVEAIPPKADHDWMKQVFSRFGSVVYVSLPKYKKSRRIKEFGFIEFEKEESVLKAVKAFHKLNGAFSMLQIDPAELRSIKAHIKEQLKEADPLLENNGAAHEMLKTSNKRKNNGTDEAPLAKIKKEEPSDGQTATDDDSEEETSTSAVEGTTAKECTEIAETANELPKKRRRQKKNKSKKRKAGEISEASFCDLRVMPKRIWNLLRTQYLNLQRQRTSEFKRAVRLLRVNLNDGSETISCQPPAITSKPRDRQLQKINMNFYGAGDADASECTAICRPRETKNNPALERAPLFSYEPGLIVEVSFHEVCVKVRDFKAFMRQYAAVKYVDVKEGEMKAYVRFESAAAAEEFIKKINCIECKFKTLTGEGELEYWRKIEKDRDMKLNKLVKVPQKRGRERIKKLIAKYCYGDVFEKEAIAFNTEK